MIDRVTDYHIGADWLRSTTGLYLPPGTTRRPLYGSKPIAIDLFCGCGGFSLGFIQAGFRVVAAIDNEPEASITYIHNLGTYPIEIHYVEEGNKERLDKSLRTVIRDEAKETGRPKEMILSGHGWIRNHHDVEGVPHFWFGDIRKVAGKDILEALGLERGEVDAVMGGPPCQGFSISGRRDVMDPRNSLVFEFARLVLEIQPKTFVMENVPGLISMVTPEGTPVMDAFCRIIADGGFGKYETLRRSLLASVGLNPGVALRGSQRDPEKGAKKKKRKESQLALSI